MYNYKKSFFYSAVFHLLLMLMFLIIKVPITLPVPQEIIEIVSLEEILPQRIERVNTLNNPSPPSQNNQIITPPQNNNNPVLPNDPVAKPQVTIPDEEIDISLLQSKNERDKPPLTFNNNNRNLDDLLKGNVNPNLPQENSHQVSNQIDDNLGFEGFAKEISTQTNNFSQYRLEGDVVNRIVVNRVIPEYPPRMMSNGVVTLQFVVVENGSVQNISIVRSSESEFNTAAIEAFQQWSFNRADRTHTGQVTFNFRAN